MVTLSSAGNDLSDMIFKGYITNDPNLAFDKYVQDTGEEPTALVVCPGFELSEPHPLTIESPYGSFATILATHYKTTNELGEMEENRRQSAATPKAVTPSAKRVNRKKPTPKPKTLRIRKVKCPHCSQNIEDFNELGWWHGWQFGKEPPYWKSLRAFVFRRDEYRCQSCQKTFPASKLVAHHIEPKEIGGMDSARNLQTLCLECHQDDKPLFSPE